MPCGCRKGKKVQTSANRVAAKQREGPNVAARVAVYQFVKDGEVYGDTESPAKARQEAKLPGVSLRVTSRPVQAGEPATVG